MGCLPAIVAAVCLPKNTARIVIGMLPEFEAS